MAHIKEPEGVDFLIESPPLNNKERKEISAFINKLKRKSIKEKEIAGIRRKKKRLPSKTSYNVKN